MAIEKQPFKSYTLEEERKLSKYGKPFTFRLNKEEIEDTEKLKAIFDTESEGTALKMAAFHYLHFVLQAYLHPRYMAYLLRKDRKRLSDIKDLERVLREKL